ncbi:Ribonuclease P protein subunit p25-like protein [Frankliniella fusca]|uniref:Ribonuclease P protein subunit p25-like protein n=1 Tax=Frankliniella fusca TaxID=407009 RepID=A0AAE1GVQ8_9NEOP|nr:Ribonuclease P protein subunit p25-like protein [Frankliniella fusca]
MDAASDSPTPTLPTARKTAATSKVAPALSSTWPLGLGVHGGSKIRNLLDVALKGFVDQGAVVWTGSGPAISKTISCAEILKRKHKAHQITKISYRKYEEYWEPLVEELDELVVVRDEPIIHILLSKEPLNSQELGYQAPGEIDSSFRVAYEKNNSNSTRNKPYTSNFEQRSQSSRPPRKGPHKKPPT